MKEKIKLNISQKFTTKSRLTTGIVIPFNIKNNSVLVYNGNGQRELKEVEKRFDENEITKEEKEYLISNLKNHQANIMEINFDDIIEISNF